MAEPEPFSWGTFFAETLDMIYQLTGLDDFVTTGKMAYNNAVPMTKGVIL